MIFADINTFYFGSDGGVKTFYNAKIEWFKQHPEHQYYLIYPDKGYSEKHIAPNVCLLRTHGIKDLIGKNRRLMIGYGKVFRRLRRIRPDVLEIGDPLLSPFAALWARKRGNFNGLLASFHHSSPLDTYIVPWAYGEKSNLFKRLTARFCFSMYRFSHHRIPYSMVASAALKNNLEKLGVPNITVKPFGVQEIFRTHARVRGKDEKHLLFAGRLEHEKGIHLLKNIIHRLLDIDGVKVTVMGKGAHENFFKKLDHPSFQYLGYIEDRDAVEEVYRRHTVFLAPGPFETFGIGVLEAMTNGLIVVGPSQGGTGELLSAMDSPFLFKPDDAQDFYRTAVRALECDKEAESRRSLEGARQFCDWNTAIEAMIHYYIEKTHEQKSPGLTA